MKQEALIEDALHTLPVTGMPRSVTGEVMRRIQFMEARRPAIFTWRDFILSCVIAACVSAVWFAWRNLPPILAAKIRIQGILLYQDYLVNAPRLIPALLFGLAAILAMVTIPYLLQALKNVTHSR